jgi:hypothetical protein
VTIVFNGYNDGPGTKDHEHERRSHKAAPDVISTSATLVYGNQLIFLQIEVNKQAFVSMLMEHLSDMKYGTVQAHNDVDTLIVTIALTIARKGENVTVLADDTNILILLMFHYDDSMADIVTLADSGKRAMSKVPRCSVRQLCSVIGRAATGKLLVIHAFSGCDTTSSLFGMGKVTVWKKLTQNAEVLKHTDTLRSFDATGP